MPEINATKKEQIKQFIESNGGIAVIYFHATWCGTCKAISPYVKQKSEETKIPLIKVNIDQAVELSQNSNINAIPAFVVAKGIWNIGEKIMVGGSKGTVNTAFQEALKNK